ncbi:site-specific integrase [Undibacterium crateris]|uniref:site-specific integrase n=1 Tax=Undibacterium crateris TaxID=2528175 RepID=UPI001389CB15|nr:site-specific integrase [Undibacterium crateris]NDI85127.1 tyrosine-type recombinase/integrase [Undibacterium crateris]
MATKRQKNKGWEYVIKRKSLLAKPLYLTFADEAEGDSYVAKLEALLDRGIVPQELFAKKSEHNTIADLIKEYLVANSVPDSDERLLNVQYARIGEAELKRIDYAWVEKWVFAMKVEYNLSPDTIRHHVGALGRCFDWAGRRNIVPLVINPIRQLPKRYAQYSDRDVAAARAFDGEHAEKSDDKRDRRLEPGEEERIRSVMARDKPSQRERPLEMNYQAAIELIFDLALESAMRMREMFSLTLDQISLEKKTIFLDKTKNGNKRQVPLSRKAIASISSYLEIVSSQSRGMAGFNHQNDLLFPWLDGFDGLSLRQTTSKLSRQFARIFDAAGCGDLRFHDLRHEATSRLFEKTNLSDFEIMKITGHSSTRMLARYGNLRASNLADRLG